MSEYRFHLQKYKHGSKISCPQCKCSRCLVRYVDEKGIVTFPDYVGRCDHENSCGYHFTPRDYYKENPDAMRDELSIAAPIKREPMPKETRPASYIDQRIMKATLQGYQRNHLFAHVRKVFGEKEAMRLFQMYYVGTANKWGGSTVFWQIDINGNVRAGKIIDYNAENGHRVKHKEHGDKVSWAHAVLRLPNFNLQQSLFGEHLLKDNASPVALVESEKTALIATHFMPDYIWLATGGNHGTLNIKATKVLKGRRVLLVPDLGMFDKWVDKLQMLKANGCDASILTYLEEHASPEQKEQGLDIADFLLQEETDEIILQRMMDKNPALRTFVETLDLQLVKTK